ncbi:thioredoxin family protein [Methanohalophilus halophilus]|uniref:Thioredoxin n=1 Tax=Methanohalophilus halophilus TaxID=2177 RepID=A0A1L3Q4C5_9EURY|nr:thioredoxin family protein [Methanohalophilus halophilus]APH39695.1 thioredoxin family protein [Methanohalophilus halophilus]RNI08970.1 thioredoxin family protein [Methanohalophilus halophilus]SDW36086.1 small redox-active disulfide protein 2 [Methanohalophilus halophilus]
MKIEILGTGCAKCKKTLEVVERAVKEAGIEADITKVEDINSIMDYGVMITPGVVVDGDVKIAGKIPSVDDVKEWLQ